jgi:hypothetical protein
MMRGEIMTYRQRRALLWHGCGIALPLKGGGERACPHDLNGEVVCRLSSRRTTPLLEVVLATADRVIE